MMKHNKQELNLQIEQHTKLIKKIVEVTLNGIKPSEVIELKNLCLQDRFEYYKKINSNYAVQLGLLSLSFNITEQVEECIFFLIHDIIHKITIDSIDLNSPLTIQVS